MLQPLKGHYQGVRTVTDTCTYMYTCNTSVHVQYEVMFEDSGARDVNCLLSEFQMFKMYTNLYYLAKSMMTVFLWSQVCCSDMFVFTDVGLRTC
jgi:hypothetical protein